MGFLRKISQLLSPVETTPSQGSVLDIPLLALSQADEWTIRDAVSGCFVLGGPGSGKSSGPAKSMILQMLEIGMGGFVLCAKNSEAGKWRRYCREAGRENDLVVFSPENPELKFNPLDFEMRRSGRGGGYTGNVTSLFKYLLEISEGGEKSGQGHDPFWERACLELISNTTDVLALAGYKLSLYEMNELIKSCPTEPEEFQSKEWQNSSFCFHCLALASQKAEQGLSEDRRHDLEMAIEYLGKEFPGITPKTKSSILATFKGMALPFLKSPFREIFGTDTTLRLEDIFERGSIILIDYPLREFSEIGRIAGALMKYFFMTAVERRNITDDTPPCFLCVDECQEFVTSYDSRFLATARESRCCTLFITQNVSNIYATIKSNNAKFIADALLANFMTKVFCSNADALTNQFAADVIAQSWQHKAQSSSNTGESVSHGSTISEQLAHDVLPQEFTMLTKGGPPQNIVETVFFQGGRIFNATGKTYMRAIFEQ